MLTQQEWSALAMSVQVAVCCVAISAVPGIAVALLLAGYYAYRRYEDPSFPIGVPVALVTLILLNARQNLRQYKCAPLLMATRGEEPPA